MNKLCRLDFMSIGMWLMLPVKLTQYANDSATSLEGRVDWLNLSPLVPVWQLSQNIYFFKELMLLFTYL